VSNQPPGWGLVYWLSGALVIITVIAATITLAAAHLHGMLDALMRAES